MTISRQALDKQLRVLERAGFVSSRRGGREVLYAVERQPLDQSAAWLTSIADSWDRRPASLRDAAEEG